MIAILSAKGAPGASTAVAVLASVWPSRLVVADCDPQGGDLAVGWLAHWWLDGRLRDERGLLSFATTTRHVAQVTGRMLSEHLQTLPFADRVQVLVGLRDSAQATAMTGAGWQRLATVLSGLGRSSDVIVDCGRFGATTPWSLLTAADLVLLAVRPVQRHILAGRSTVGVLRERIPPTRLGLAIRAETRADASEARRVLGLPAGLVLREDSDAARVFSDGADFRGNLRRSPLVRVATQEAQRLHSVLNTTDDAAEPERPHETTESRVARART